MKIAITDANIFIDIVELEFTKYLFQIEIEIHTTTGVLDELNKEQQDKLEEYIVGENLIIHFPREEQLLKMNEAEFDRGFSDADCFLLHLCKEYRMILLSGERKMKIFCNEEDLESHGVIWLFDEFLRLNLIGYETAVEKMENLLVMNKRLPIDICKKRMTSWRQQI